MHLGGTVFVTECPQGLMDAFSIGLCEMFQACHTISAGFGGPIILQHSWPRSGGLPEQYPFVVDAFQIIRSEIMTMATEDEKHGQ